MNQRIIRAAIGAAIAASIVLAVGARNQPLPTKSQIRKAMDTHRDGHPACEVCGAKASLFRQAVYVRYKDGSPKWKGPDGKVVPPRQIMAEYGIEIAAKQLPVHHVKSQKPFPELAADTNNMVTLCWTGHFWLGHLGGHYKDHDANLRQTIDAVKGAVEEHAVSYNSTVAP